MLGAQRKQATRFSRRRLLAGSLGLLAGSLVVACGSDEASARRTEAVPPELPAFAYASEKSLRGYRAALANPDVVEQIPCYCGCGTDPRFKSLRNCFITVDGAWEQHAASCEICLDEVLDVAAMLDRGVPTADIRTWIDARYSRYGPPTDTPPVKA